MLVIMHIVGSTALHVAASTSKEPEEQGFAKAQLSEKFGTCRKLHTMCIGASLWTAGGK